MALEPATDEDDYRDTMTKIHELVTKLHMEHQDQLPMWTVLGPGTSDQPDMYLARLWLTLPEPVCTNVLIRGNSLEQIRELLPDGLSMLQRSREDDANIIEVWF